MAIYRGTGGSAEATNNATVNEVAGYATDAETSATNAASSATSAASSATSASSSATASASSATASESSATASATSASASATSATNASTSASQAASSASAASTSASNALTSETNAASSETAAASSATSAATSATNAATSLAAIGVSETNAANSASNASTSETNAATSASEAAASAASIVSDELESAANAAAAAQSYDNFDDRYLGAKASDPTVDNDGDALITGAMYFDSSNNVMKVYSGTEWQNASSSIEGIKSDFVFTATASQVLFSGSDDNTNTLVIDKAGLVNVYLNGVRLTDADYTIDAPGNSVTLGSGATVGDIVEIEVFGNFAGQSGADVAITGGSITGLTELSTGTFTSTGIDDNATSTAITIDASENVGIGCSPSNTLDLRKDSPAFSQTSSSGAYYTTLGTNVDYTKSFVLNNKGSEIITYGDDSGFGLNLNGGAANLVRFQTNSTERMRIDSSGNLLVGKTSTNFNTDGFQAFSGGFVHATTTQGTANSGTVITVNRKSTDGSIVDLKKDGSTVGSIGTTSAGNFAFYSPSEGGLETAAVGILPMMAGVRSDNQTDLGFSSSRFKDLYLSGGVYLGGTGAANKLDDYEEGTWTLTQWSTAKNLTVNSSRDLRYTKVGRLVTLTGAFNVSTASGGVETALFVTLPFSAHNSTFADTGVATILLGAGANRFGIGNVMSPTTNSTRAGVYFPGNQVNTGDNDAELTFSFTYMTA
jgi:hypothetical protein